MKWINHFIKMAELVSTMSKDPNLKWEVYNCR